MAWESDPKFWDGQWLSVFPMTAPKMSYRFADACEVI